MSAAIDSKGMLWTWGTNEFGELGVNDNDPKIHPYPVLSLKGKQVTQISCGGSFVLALGSNLKKEIPVLKLHSGKESEENIVPKKKAKSKSKSKSRLNELHKSSTSKLI